MSDAVIYIDANGKPASPPTTTKRRWVLGIDATNEHRAVWDIAAAKLADGNQVQLAWFAGCCGRGVDLPTEQFETSGWCSTAAELGAAMSRIRPAPGCSELGQILRHALAEHVKNPIDGIAIIGDHCDEAYHHLAAVAGEVAAVGIPIHTWLAGDQPAARNAYRMLSLSTGGEPFTIETTSDRELIGRQFAELSLPRRNA